MAIEKGGHTFMMRLLAIDLEHTFNHSKHTMYILCCREQSNKEQYHVGTTTYNTVLKNGCLRYLREINSLWQLIWYLYNRVL
jgi:hypothetical protein